MKWRVLFLSALLLVGVYVSYRNWPLITQHYQALADVVFPPKPCERPIHYKIGTIDPQFNISQQTFSQDITQAATIWNAIAGKPLFVYDPQGKLTISMVYDGRQTIETQIDQMQGQLKTSQNQLDPAIAQYKQAVADFRAKVADLNAQIKMWNDKGGAPPDVYNQLVSQQQALKNQADQLNAQAKQLNQSTESYNTNVDVLNQTVSDFNSQLAVKPEEGIYDPNQDLIAIYFNISHNELVHTLAHEMGHALGLNHSPDKSAIMYPSTTASVTPSQADKAALNLLCHAQ